MSLESRSQQNTEAKNPKGMETSTYHLEDSNTNVELIWTAVAPSEGVERVEGRAVILLSGWGNTRLASMDELPRAFSDGAHADTYVMVPRTEERADKVRENRPDFLYEEARAVARFIKEKGIKEVTLAGHSMGADRTIDLAAILQEDPEMTIKGLVLMGPTGMYDQTPFGLAKNFLTHTGLQIPAEAKKLSAEGAPFIRDLAQNPDVTAAQTAAQILEQGSSDGTMSLLSEIARSWGVGPAFLRRMKSDVLDMAAKNPHLAEIRAPIVIIAGGSDVVADREKIVPLEEEEKIRKEMGEEPGQRKDLIAREQYLRENLFTNSPYVRMIVPEKMGNHLVQIFRPEAVAKVSLYFLERYAREQEKKTTSEKI